MPITPSSSSQAIGKVVQNGGRLVTPRNAGLTTGNTLAQLFGQAATYFGEPQHKMLKNMPSALLSSSKDQKMSSEEESIESQYSNKSFN